jgi:hypothetical protein
MAPLIRFTLLTLYLALVAPLPLLAPGPLRWPLGVAVAAGLLLVTAATSERVQLTADAIQVGHPAWCAWLLRRGWTLPWDRVTGLTPVATSQGGRVYYVRSANPGCSGLPQAHLLPQRVARFDDFLARFQDSSGVPTDEVVRISPLWTYRLLAILAAGMLAAEVVMPLVFGSPDLRHS